MRGTDGEISPSRIVDTGSLSARASRRISAPLRMFWGGSSGSGSGNGSGSGAEEKIVLPERQPSPLRSVMRVDGFEKDEDGDDDGRVGGREDDTRRLVPLMGGSSARPSLDESVVTSTSFRPSLDSARPSMDSYMGSSSVSASVSVRRSPEPGYVREGSRPPTRLTERQGLMARVRKRSMSVQESLGAEFGTLPIGLRRGGDGSGSAGNVSSAALSARERLARARYGDLGGGARPWSSMSMRSGKTENLNVSVGAKGAGRSSRVAGGLLDYERERSPVLGGIERSMSERTGERDMVQYRERSGSGSGVGTLGRYASLRSASEYNFAGGNGSSVNLSMQHQAQHQQHPRSYSRMAFSESSGGSGGRRGSGTFSAVGNGLMESPTLTVSTSASGSRDTQRSSSTGATSLSQASAKEREREREELKELREKHAVETGALLSALSDSQRTCRVLRDENGELREKVADVEGENERLRRILGDLEREIERLKFSREWERERGWERERMKEREWERERGIGRGLSASAGPGAGGWKPIATPLAKQRETIAGSRLLPRLNKWQVYERDVERYEESETTMKHSRSKLDNVLFSRESEPESRIERHRSLREEDFIIQDEQKEDGGEFRSTSTPPSTAHHRRPSTTSSIFPIPPPNMTMLLHDDTAILPDSKRSSDDVLSIKGFKLPMSPVLPIPRTLKDGHAMNNSVSSNVSVSPTENFSMVTGSPGSLFLKPEHEMMLGEMESLDLGRSEKSEGEVWNE